MFLLVFSDSLVLQRVDTIALTLAKSLCFIILLLEKKIFSLNLCACNNVSLLIWVPESRPWDRHLDASSLFGRKKGWGNRERETGKAEKQMKVALLRSQLEATGLLRSIQMSPRIVLLKDGKWGIYPSAPIPTGLGLPAGCINLLCSWVLLCACHEAALKPSEKALRQKSREMQGGAILLE